MAGQHRSTPHGWLIPATVMLRRMTNIYIPQWNLSVRKICKQHMQGSPIALAFFGLTIGAWAASSAFRPDNKDTFQDTECISIHFKASVEGCQHHPKSREFPWNKFLGSLTPSALKPTNYSPTRVRPVLSFNCTTQSGSSVNLVVCKCNSWQLWFNWLEPDMLCATWLQHKMFTWKEKNKSWFLRSFQK